MIAFVEPVEDSSQIASTGSLAVDDVIDSVYRILAMDDAVESDYTPDQCWVFGVDEKAAAAADFAQCNECSKAKLKDVHVSDLSYCRAPCKCSGSEGVVESDTLSSADLAVTH